MKCPNDQTTLVMSERKNIEIDYCPECRGVWLDRGELDKMLEQSGSFSPSVQTSYTEPRREHRAPHEFEHSSHEQKYHHKRKKKESFLGDLFDF